MPTSTRSKPLRAKDKVRATHDLKGVPKGTQGVIKLVDGIVGPRYWVKWENGVWMGSLLDRDIVRASDWEDFQRGLEEDAQPAPAPAPAAAVAAAEEAPAAKTGGIPAHLLERSKAARAKKATDPG